MSKSVESKQNPELKSSPKTVNIHLTAILRELVAVDNKENPEFSRQNIDALFALPHWKKNIEESGLAPIFWVAALWKTFGIMQRDHNGGFSTSFLKTVISKEELKDNHQGVYHTKEASSSEREAHIRPPASANGKFGLIALVGIATTLSHEVTHGIVDVVYQDSCAPPSRLWSEAVFLTQKLIERTEAENPGCSIESIELSKSSSARPVLTALASVFKSYPRADWSGEFIARITESIISYGAEATWQAFTDKKTRLAVQAAYQSFLSDCQSTLHVLTKNPYIGKIINVNTTGGFAKDSLELSESAAENLTAVIQSEDLHRMMKIGNPRIIKELLSSPAKIEKLFNQKDKNEKTPYQLLLEGPMPISHKIEVLKYLSENSPEKREELNGIIKTLEVEKGSTPWGGSAVLFKSKVAGTAKPLHQPDNAPVVKPS